MTSPPPLAIRWIERIEAFHRWLAHNPAAAPRVLHSSREATIWELATDAVPVYVIKRWKPDRWVDARANYRLLRSLDSLALPAVAPAGWGFDGEDGQVLAMRYAGEPVDRASRVDVEAFGRTLALIHAAPLDRLDLAAPANSPAFFRRLRERFFNGVDAFEDLAALLHETLPQLPPLETVLMHGDYHLGNVARGAEGLSVLDWSEAQLGDWRYDLAWSGLLTLIYTGPQARDTVVGAYITASGRSPGEGMRSYEIIAAIRWLLLSRTAPFPVPAEWQRTVEAFLQSRLRRPQRAIPPRS